MPDELVSELIKDCQVSILQLNCAELAAQVTLRDFQLFHDIEPTEYIDDLLNLKSSFGTPHLNVFSEVRKRSSLKYFFKLCTNIQKI